ncbi:UxaA family hydrolase [Lacrimispora sp. 210928-DFI.3.58]|uniref:UxaA family hydrolase n=1 Tax=Lacrimispora sp. 210928-DFI.3.58 TaxID=2883214 RepID=UPI001D08F316|nr:UxaA family hydrolase [Lacrimispora sp. 210928-DFI.3.58]MCB7319117.1 UxaA family hydrolase [Lacrimispora sp. 210928-DFI.3.58]
MKINAYKRMDGRVGIRNHVVVMPGVLCAEVAAKKIVQETEGTTFLYNQVGCGQNQKDKRTTLDVLSGMIANGNVYGALIVGLGCETIQKEEYLEAIKKKTGKPVYYISIQEEGGIANTVKAGKAIAEKLRQEADKCRREEVDISELFLGLECGGSDPTSGLSCNTVLGKVTDYLIDANGTAAMSETAEAIGAEHILRERGRTPEIGQQIYDAIVKWERDRYEESGEDIRAGNPSPGNIAGGITTLSEKSLGCIHKSGSRPFDGCYEYGELIEGKGLYFINAAAFDVVNTVALVASGAQLVAFTTGRGNPIGNPIAPVVKITGNHEAAIRFADFIDLDTSESLSGKKSFDELSREMLEYMVRVCNGEPVKAEINGACEMAVNQINSYS